MKLSEFKEIITNKYGEEAWKNYEGTFGYSIYSVTEEKQKRLVQKDGTYIRYINNPSERVQIEAIKQYPFNIEYIHNPSEKLQLEAVKENPLAIIYIKNPTEKVIQEAIKGLNYSFDSEYMLRHIENDLKEG